MGFEEWDYDSIDGCAICSADQYLFGSKSAFILIEESRHREAPTACNPTVKKLTPQDAVKWCLRNDVELPESLEADCPIDLLTPSNKETVTSVKSEAVPFENESMFNEDSDDSSNVIGEPPRPSLRELLTDGLSIAEMNKLTELIELERQFSEQPAGKSNPLYDKRYQADRYQKQRADEGKRNLAVVARQIFEAEKGNLQNLNVQ